MRLRNAAFLAAFFFHDCSPVQAGASARAEEESSQWQKGSLRFEKRLWEAPAVFAGRDAWATVHVVNPSDHPITITAVRVRSAAGKVSGLPLRIEPEGRGEFRVGLSTLGQLGVTSARFGVYTDEPPESAFDPKLAPYRLSISTFVRSAYTPERFIVDFGTIDQSKSAQVEARFVSRDVTRLLVRGAVDRSGWVNATAEPQTDPQAQVLRMTLNANAPVGDTTGVVEVTTNVKDQPVLYVPYRAMIYGDIVPDTPRLDYGMRLLGHPSYHVVELSSRSGTAFNVERISDPNRRISDYAVSSCVKKRPDCASVKLVFDPREPGMVSGTVDVFVTQGEMKRSVPIPYSAVVSVNRESNP